MPAAITPSASVAGSIGRCARNGGADVVSGADTYTVTAAVACAATGDGGSMVRQRCIHGNSTITTRTSWKAASVSRGSFTRSRRTAHSAAIESTPA